MVVSKAERVEVDMLMERVVQLVREGVTGMDLFEVYLTRRIQPLQARDHPMWLYSGTDDSSRVHLEAAHPEYVVRCLKSITGNKDNPRGSGRIIPFDADHLPDKVSLPLPNDVSVD